MNIQDFRHKTGLGKREFVQKIQPYMNNHNLAMSEKLLDRIESGEQLSDDRMRAYSHSLEKSFPHSFLHHKKSNWSGIRIRIERRHVALLIFIGVSALVSVLFYMFSYKVMITEILALLGSIATILGLIFALYKMSS